MPRPHFQQDSRSLIDIDSTFLPVGEMRQICRVTAVSDTDITGEVDAGPDHWVYRGHLPGDPIFPGTLLIEAAGQLVALWAWAQGHRGRPRLARASADFRHPIKPAAGLIVLRAAVRARKNLSFAQVDVWSAGMVVAQVEATLAVLGSPQS
jgi:3-hydroxymyristoyl/3-hydroxydecanoyl-(acyl carrier protein) dehydratase